MRLYPKMILIIGCMFIAILIVLLVSFEYNIMNSFSSLEEQHVEQELQRAEQTIKEDIKSLQEVATDWAEWDLMYTYAETRDPSFIQSNFAPSTFSALKIKYLIIQDKKGEYIHGIGISGNKTSLISIPEGLVQALPKGEMGIITNRSGLFHWNNSAYMIAQNPVLPTDHKGEARGTVTIIRPLDQVTLSSISATLLENVTALILTPESRTPIYSGSRTHFSNEIIQAETILSDVEGNPFLLLRVEEIRDLYESGLLSRDFLFFSLLLLAVSFMGIAITLINLIVIAPLGELNKDLEKIGKTGLLSGRIPSYRTDEIGELGRSINQMLDQIEKAVEQRQATEQRLSRLIALAEEGICLVGPDAKIWFANPKLASMFGMTPLELNGLEILTLLKHNPDKKTELADLFQDQPVHREYHTRKKDGTDLYVSVLAAPYPLDKEEGHLCVISDITTFKNNEKALLLSNKKLGLLGSMTRHDIVNQLTTIRGMLGLVHRKTNDEVILNLVESAEEAAERIHKHIEFTKEYQKAGIQAPVWQNLQTCCSLAYAMTKKKGLTFSYEGGAFEVFADQLLQKVFYNLIDNSLKHGKNVFYITIRTETRGKNLVIIYEDDGEGIQDSMKERVFERGVGYGTGWGLFFAREVLGLTDITISEQGTFGIGARFEISVPEGSYRSIQEIPDTVGEKEQSQ